MSIIVYFWKFTYNDRCYNVVISIENYKWFRRLLKKNDLTNFENCKYKPPKKIYATQTKKGYASNKQKNTFTKFTIVFKFLFFHLTLFIKMTLF